MRYKKIEAGHLLMTGLTLAGDFPFIRARTCPDIQATL